MSINEENKIAMANAVASAIGVYDKETEEAAHNEFMTAGVPVVAKMTPEHAAYLFINKNTYNRNVNERHVEALKMAIKRDEWKLNHQGIAFYDDGAIADGQHRTAAIAMAGVSVDVLMFPNFEKDAIQTIDAGHKREAKDALDMEGFNDSTMMASVANRGHSYINRANMGVSPKFSNSQVVEFCHKEKAALEAIIDKAKFLRKTVSDPCMTETEIATHLYVMTEAGEFTTNGASDFIEAVLTGIADSHKEATFLLHTKLTSHTDKKKKAVRFSDLHRQAITQKAADLWSSGKVQPKLEWTSKEGFLIAKNRSV